ncbi:hypothetical protein CRV24_003050 [Beauveria bassiana]|uniref:Uncharacterized protein n=1 Tax=Beauveria bassiana (strain ARSEF 2860) TaxID=655819 RepID=J4WIF3_BEAB2|nr:uncharacterized protein BBA_01585 [Beauveria bassiana ARSEF 2860]EJP69620.1 hypothetical protein BBA_01585 [Beauveria bassiana ARSEF 2860]KAF1737432.1 hypothetical protein CRV24_003050 [Beauveria bassiana]KAH8718444.1 hypothetical protein HC256_003087 [Beauveria bassiana]
MGNICGKQEPEDRLGPGRRLGSAPPQAQTAAVPKAKTKQTYQSEARVVGGSGAGSNESPRAGQNTGQAAREARERWSAMEDKRKEQEALKRKKGGARVLTQKEVAAQDRRRQEIEANERQVQGRID